MKTKLQVSAIVLFILLVKWSFPTIGQQIIFNKLPPPDGKPFQIITSITQDPDGYMWFATRNGLYKYDGYQFNVYNRNPLNLNSLACDSLNSIAVDSTGIIWIGTWNGLDRFDPNTGKFKHYRHNPKNTGSISSDWVGFVFIDHEGILWLASDGLDRYDKQTDTFIHYRNMPGDSTSLSSNEVNTIYEDKQGVIWVGTGSVWDEGEENKDNGGLNRLNKKNGTFTRYKHDPNKPNSLINNKVSAILEDSKGTFWIGTAGDGLHTMDREKGTFVRHTHDPVHPEKLSRPLLKNLNKEEQRYQHITFINEDATGTIWIGTFLSGMINYNIQTGQITNFESNKGFEGEYGVKMPSCFYTSKEGVIWIGTGIANLYRINPILKQIPHFSISNGGAYTFYEEPNGTLWIGTPKELIRIDKSKGIIKHDVIDVNPSIADDNHIAIIKPDRQGNVWIGSIGGLTKWEKKKDSFTHYKIDIKNNDNIGNIVYKIFEDKEDNLWIGKRRGLSLFNRETGFFSQFLFFPNDTTNSSWINSINDIIQDKTGNLWVSTWAGGINLFNPENKNFKTYLKGKNINCFCLDAAGILWVGGDGLYKFETGSDNFIPYIDSISLSGISDIITLIEDNQRNLWLGTSKSLVRINPQRNRMYIYGKEYGVGEYSLHWEEYKGRNGELYFGDETGYFQFDPKELTQNMKPPQILFTSFSLSDEVVKPGNHGPLKVSLSQAKEIKLGYNQNVFSFEFAAIDYSNPEDNQHFCMLENYDKDWRKSNSERRAYYFNVPPGKYVFHVKAMNRYGVWSEKIIDVIIMPPWWRTWWAYGIYGLLFIASVYGIDRFQRRRLLKAERERNRQRELEHAREIEKAYTTLKATQIQLIQSEKMASLGELTAGIAHEIQNPLNFVNNFSEVNTELIEEMKQELEKGNMDEVKSIAEDIAVNEKKIAQHGKRADSIVKGMLQHSRKSSGIKEPTDINALADEFLRLTYHGLKAKDKSFNTTIKSDFDPSIGKINVTAQEMGRVLMNLLNNAFYAVNEKRKLNIEGYEPTVTVSTQKLKEMVEIKVSDNGNGIPQALLDKIFQPFFTTKPSGEGTGLGLSLSYDIVTKGHGGELTVDTKEGQYTTFRINLPV